MRSFLIDNAGNEILDEITREEFGMVCLRFSNHEPAMGTYLDYITTDGGSELDTTSIKTIVRNCFNI